MSLLELFCHVDDFCQRLEPQWQQQFLAVGSRRRQRRGQLSTSEMLTIMIHVHQTHYRDFKA